jgi:hypothetical protein
MLHGLCAVPMTLACIRWVNDRQRMPKQVTMALSAQSSDDVEAAGVVAELRRRDFDLRRRMFLSFLIDFAGGRDAAFRGLRLVESSDWDSALYGDTSGWVLRLSRTRRLTPASVVQAVSDVRRLARGCDGVVRGVSVEDLRNEDCWGAMAETLRAPADADVASAPGIPSPRAETGSRTSTASR